MACQYFYFLVNLLKIKRLGEFGYLKDIFKIRPTGRITDYLGEKRKMEVPQPP